MADKSQPPLKKQRSEETPTQEKSEDEQTRRSSEPAVSTQSLRQDSIESAESVSSISTPSESSAGIHPNQSDSDSLSTRCVLGSRRSDITDDISVTSSVGELERPDTPCSGELPSDPIDVIRFKQKKSVEQAKSTSGDSTTQGSVPEGEEQEKPSVSKKNEDSGESEGK